MEQKKKTPSANRSRFGNAARTIAVSALCLLVVLLITEVVLRATHLFGARLSWVQPDTELGWRFTPNRTYWYGDENDHPITGKINSYGWRDREWSVKKEAGTIRVAVIGDSFVEAFQVEDDSTFVALTERRLQVELGRGVELMNFGRSGMTQTEELLVLRKDVAPFSPDVVVLFFTPMNDIADVDRRTAINDLRSFYVQNGDGSLTLDSGFTQRRQFKLKTFLNPFKQRSALVSLALQKYNTLRWNMRASRMSPGASSDKGMAGYLRLCTASPDGVHAENYRLNKVLIGEMAEFCRERGIRFLLVCVNMFYRCDDEGKIKALDPTFDAGFYDDDLGSLADSLGIEYLGLEKLFARECEKTGRSWHWIHWNYDGHRAVSDAMAEKLKSFL